MLLSVEADEATATSCRQRSIRWDLEAGALMVGRGSCWLEAYKTGQVHAHFLRFEMSTEGCQEKGFR